MVLFININNNQRVEVKHLNKIYTGTVKYKGCINGKDGDWVGLVLDKKVGDNNGTLGARQYFECPPGHGLFTTANKIRFKRLQRSLYHNYNTVDRTIVEEELFGNLPRDAPNKPSQLPSDSLEYIKDGFKEAYSPLASQPTFSLRHSISGTMPAATMRRPRTAPLTRPTYTQHRDSWIAQRTTNRCDFYDSDSDDGFESKPTIPKTHMPHSSMRHQVTSGWGDAHAPRYVTVNTARHTIKRAHHWTDLD